MKWQDNVPDTERILEQIGMSSVFTMHRKSQLRWAGHVTRMSDERLPKRLLYGEMQTGVRCHGGQKKRFKDTLKASMKNFGVDHNSWETLAQDRSARRTAIHKGAAAYKQQRIETAKTKQAARKARCTNLSAQASAPLSCLHCARTIRTRIGLISHLRIHPVL